MMDYPLSAAEDGIRPLLSDGHFFPRDRTDFSALMTERRAALPPAEPVRAAAAMVPHGGLDYAGSGLAWTLQQLPLSSVKAVVIMALVHREEEESIWLPDYSGFHTHFGVLPVPREKLDELAGMRSAFRLGRIPFEEEPCFDLILSALGNLGFSGRVLPVLFGSENESLLDPGLKLLENLGGDYFPMVSANFPEDHENGTIHGERGKILLKLLNMHFHASPGRWYHGEGPQYSAALWLESPGTGAEKTE